MDPVCIIGAGPAGLAAAAALKKRGLPFRVLEAGPGVGGIWDIGRARTPMYDSAHFISSRTLSGFPDFPMPEDYPDYPRHDRILAYVRDYARHHRLEEDVTFGVRVTSARHRKGNGEPGWGGWAVTVEDSGEGPGSMEVPEGPLRFSALVVATGSNWHPNLPDLPGEFRGEIRHSFTYRSRDELRGRRVLVVGAGNSGVDIACDAAEAADRAFLSLRRGYHFVPKYVFGVPADVFAHGGPRLPPWLEERVFGFLLDRILVGDLTRFGLPKPDHPVLASHPIMNTRVLHHLGHGELEARPDVERLQGDHVVFSDGSREQVDLILLATGYRRAFPFLVPDPELRMENGEFPREDLFLNLFHRQVDSLFVLGLFETDGAAYGLFGAQAELVARALEAQRAGGETAERLAAMRRAEEPDLTGGRRFVDSPRHTWYVTEVQYRKAMGRLRRRMGWD